MPGRSGANAPTTPTRLRCRERLADERFDLGSGSSAGCASYLSPTLEHGHGWDRPDPEAFPQLRNRIGVHLRNHVAAGIRGGYPLQLRSDHAAWTAPGSPEIDDHRERGRGDQRIEGSLVGHVDRFSGKGERCTAAAALRRGGGKGHPVPPSARGAREDDPCCVHLQRHGSSLTPSRACAVHPRHGAPGNRRA